MSILDLLFRPRHVFRPEVEALLDAEMRRHRQQIDKLTAYAVGQEEAKAREIAKDTAGGGRDPAERPIERPAIE